MKSRLRLLSSGIDTRSPVSNIDRARTGPGKNFNFKVKGLIAFRYVSTLLFHTVQQALRVYNHFKNIFWNLKYFVYFGEAGVPQIWQKVKLVNTLSINQYFRIEFHPVNSLFYCVYPKFLGLPIHLCIQPACLLCV